MKFAKNKDVEDMMRSILDRSNGNEGEWGSRQGDQEISSDEIHSIKKGKDAILLVKGVIEEQVRLTQNQIDELRQKISRMKNGGIH